jgi:hypothetical protein
MFHNRQSEELAPGLAELQEQEEIKYLHDEV